LAGRRRDFCTGTRERKARNILANPRCSLTTGRNSFTDGLDVVVEGGEALVYAIAPVTAFGFAKGTFSQTRWRFRV